MPDERGPIRLAPNEAEVCIMREKGDRKLFACPTATSDGAKKICRMPGLKRNAQLFVYVPPKDRRCRRKN